MNPKQLLRKALPRKAIPLAEEAYRRGRLWLLQARYGFPARGARVIAVTGTNGKTTTCCMINEVLKAAGYRTAMLTTVAIELDGASEVNKTHHTVLPTADLLHFLRRAKRKGVDFVILEVTSHALHQHKLASIPVEVVVMTNLTQDHLEYHGTMERYAATKARLFNEYMNPKVCVLNRDDEWYEYFAAQSAGRVVSYGQRAKSTFHMQHLSVARSKTEFKAVYSGRTLRLATPLLGEFNAYNAAAAALTGLQLGLKTAEIKDGLANLTAIPARMERIDAGQQFEVLVDYAHTPDALEKTLAALQEVAKGSVIVVFGATGDHDKAKRPDMGRAAANHADKIFLTDDETYTEDPAAIRRAVMEGITQAGGAPKTREIGDRLEAIQAAFQAAKPGDTVLLAGLGHADHRVMGKTKQPWDDREVARELLAIAE